MKTFKIRSILLPSDMSAEAANAFKTAAFLCTKHHATLTLLHVIDYRIHLNDNDLLNPLIEVDDLFIKDREKIFNRWVKKQAVGLTEKPETVVIGGHPDDAICTYAREIKADLIVVGTHGESGIREFFMGSDVYHVVKHAPCPVLTVPAHWTAIEHKNILFPVELSADNAAKYNILKPIIEHEDSKVNMVGFSDIEGISPQIRFKKIVSLIGERMDKDHITHDTIFIQNTMAAEKILEESELLESDLIVISPHRRHHFRDFLVSSMTKQLINHSKRPVLCV